MIRSGLGAVALLGLLAGCAEEEQGAEVPPPEILLERATAYRQACIARELEQTAAENLALLESLATNPATGPESAPMSTRDAAAGFARGYHRHAELRYALYALLDSAVNHAEATEDSLRLVERASGFSLNMPAPGTVEANAMQSYNDNLNQVLADEDHPCNWNIPGMPVEAPQ